MPDSRCPDDRQQRRRRRRLTRPSPASLAPRSPATSPAQYPAGSGVGVSVLLRRPYGTKMPCRRKTVLSAGVLATAVGSAVVYVHVVRLLDHALCVFGQPGEERVVRRKRFAGRTGRGRRGLGAREPRVQVTSSTVAGSVPPPGATAFHDPWNESQAEAELTGVVGRAGGIRTAAARAGRHAPDVGQIPPDPNIRVLGRAGGADHHLEPQPADKARGPTVRVRGSDGRLPRRLGGWVTRREASAGPCVPFGAEHGL